MHITDYDAALATIALSLPAAALLYLPMLRQMFSCQEIRSDGAFHAATRTYLMPRVLADLAERYKTDPAPIYVCDHGDGYACPCYLEKSRLPCRKIAEPQQVDLEAHVRAYVLTAHPYRSMARLRQARPEIDCRLLTDPPKFQSVLVCEWPAAAGSTTAHQ